VITVDNKDVNIVYNWNPDKFQNRLVLFRDMLDDFLDDGILQKFGTPDKDPFWDPTNGAQIAYPEKKKHIPNAPQAKNSSCCEIF
jgi:hypothetical protein